MRTRARRRPGRRLPIILLAALSILTTGCGDGTSASDHGHDHEESVLHLAGWSETAEALAEHPPLWAGRDVGFMLLITDLRDGIPRVGGPVTLRAVDAAGRTESYEASAPLHPGVYAAVLSLPTAGAWNLFVDVDGDAVSLGEATVHPDRETALHAQVAPAPDGIVVGKEQQWRLGILAHPARHETFVHAVRVPAVVVAPPDRRAVVAAPLDGRLETASGRTLPLPGDAVDAGGMLAAIHPPFTGAVAAAAEAEADAVRAATAERLAERDLERLLALAAGGDVSERRLLEAIAAAERAAAELDAAERVRESYGAAGIDGGRVHLISPVTGVVTEVHASLGVQIAAGDPVFTVLDPSVVWLRGRVPEADMLRLDHTPTAAYRLPGNEGAPHPLPDDALVYLSQEVDPLTRTAPVTFRLDNRVGLRVGMSLELTVTTFRAELGIVVPRSAVVDENGETMVFVQLDGETFEKRHVVVDGDDGAQVLIGSGLLEGERVVDASAYSILLAQAGTAVPAHGHTH